MSSTSTAATESPTYRALVLTSRDQPPSLTDLPTPAPAPGSIVIRPLYAGMPPYIRSVCDGTLPYPLPLPLTLGSSAIGRVSALGPDTTAFKVGDLVLVDIFIRARDDKSAAILLGLHEGVSEGSKKLAAGEWRHGCFGELVKVPAENCIGLDEEVLVGSGEAGLGYQIPDLLAITRMAIPYGGIWDMGVKPGEVVIIAPATGSYGGAAVSVAVGMGARVVAAGRNKAALEAMVAGLRDLYPEPKKRIQFVVLSGDVMGNAAALAAPFGAPDAYLDFSPAPAAGSTHIEACLGALKGFGTASFMGGIPGSVSVPYGMVMFKSLKISGRFMYERDAVLGLVKMVEAGLVKLGEKGGVVTKVFEFEDWDAAFTYAAEEQGFGKQPALKIQK